MNIRALPPTPPFIMADVSLLTPEQQYERSLLVQDFAGADNDEDRGRAERILNGFDDRHGV